MGDEKNCANCHKPIEPIKDPWGYTSHQNKEYGYFHPHLLDSFEGNYGKAGWCDPDDLSDEAKGDNAESEVLGE